MERLSTRLIRRQPVAVSGVVLALMLSSCGQSQSLRSGSIIRATAVTASRGGADLSGSVIETSHEGSIRLNLNGFESFAHHDGAVTLRLHSSRGSRVATGNFRFRYPVFYVHSNFFPLGPGQWISFDLAHLLHTGVVPLALATTQDDPAQLLKYLAAAKGNVRSLGAELVRGVATNHYRVVADLTKYVSSLPATQRAEPREAVNYLEGLTGGKHLPVDVWIDSNQVIRQIRMDMTARRTFPIPRGVPISDPPTLVLTVDLFNFGPKPVVNPPPRRQTMTLTAFTAAVGQ